MLKLYKVLGSGVRGDICYVFRQPFEDEAFYDDWIYATFNPAKLNYSELVYKVFPAYVLAFKAYRADISDDKFIDLDGDKGRVEKRKRFYRLGPVTYMADWLCQRALGIDPETVVKRLSGYVEDVRAADSGVYIVITSEVMPTEKLDPLCWETKARLVGKSKE